MITTWEKTIPAANAIDYANVEEVAAYQHLLCKLYERAGGFDYDHKRTQEIIDLRTQASVWLRNAEPSDVPAPEGYDLLHRIVHGRPAPEFLADRYLQQLFSLREKWIGRLLSHPRQQQPTPEFYYRLRDLIRADLSPYISKSIQPEIKRKWVTDYEVKDLDSLDTPTLLAYHFFAETASLRHLLTPVAPRLTLTELLNRHDLHPYRRLAFQLDATSIKK